MLKNSFCPVITWSQTYTARHLLRIFGAHAHVQKWPMTAKYSHQISIKQILNEQPAFFNLIMIGICSKNLLADVMQYCLHGIMPIRLIWLAKIFSNDQTDYDQIRFKNIGNPHWAHDVFIERMTARKNPNTINCTSRLQNSLHHL